MRHWRVNQYLRIYLNNVNRVDGGRGILFFSKKKKSKAEVNLPCFPFSPSIPTIPPLTWKCWCFQPVFCYATCCCCIMREILWSGSNTHGLPPSRIPTIWRDTKSQKATRPQWSEALGSGGRNSSRVDDGALSRPLRSISPFPIVI